MQELFELLEDRPLDESGCFLCGCDLDASNRTVEHVFPKWLQRRFSLFDQTITLLNGTRIPYRSLTIPCCRSCNNDHLSPLESAFQSCVFSDEYRSNPTLERTVGLWACKIFFGILFKECSLRSNRTKPNSASIIRPEYVRSLKTTHAFLQAARCNVQFRGLGTDFPASIFVLDTKELSMPGSGFDFRDNLLCQSLYVHLGSRAVVVAFDGGAQAARGAEYYARLRTNRLHPVQCKEFAAKVFYMASLFNKVPLYQTVKFKDEYTINLMAYDSDERTGRIERIRIDEDRLLTFPVVPKEVLEAPDFADWNQDAYAECLSFFLNEPLAVVNPTPGMVVTLLWNEDGSFKDIPDDSV